jgi:hypothetical protein
MDLGAYVPFGLGVLAASLLIWKYPLSVPRERLPRLIASFIGAYLLFVVLDVISGRALTSMADLPKAAGILLITVAALLIANVMYLYVRRPRAPR